MKNNNEELGDLITSKICMTKDIGICGNMFGGVLLSVLDEAGAMFASTLVKSKNVVTLKIEEVLFLHPIKTGDLIEIYGDLLKVGNTSVTIKLSVKSVDPEIGSKIVCTTSMVFVKVAPNGKSTPIDTPVSLYLQELLKCRKLLHSNS
jgi:acyl-CoA thioesterase YciA